MRILHTEWSDDLGGQEKRVLAEVAGLAKRGHYAAIVCREHAKIHAEALKAGIPVTTLPFRKPYDVQSILRLVSFLKNGSFDIVNTHSGVDSWVAGLAARLARVPVLVRTRHLNIPLRRNMANFIHYLPDRYITCGENMKKTLVERCGFPREKVVSIPTGIDRVFFTVRKDPGLKMKYGLEPGEQAIANVGIFRNEKGHEVTLAAVKRVVEVFPRAKFLLVGGGPRSAELKAMAKDMGVSDYIVFTGFVENITEIYSFTDVSVLSSWSEGLPQGLLQAMAASVPVVATAVGGVPEVVIHEKTGLLVKGGDPAALAEGIIRILSDQSAASRYAENARELVMSRHTADHMLDRLESLYEDLLRSKGGRPVAA